MREEDENRVVLCLIDLGLFLVWLMSAILLYRFEQRQEALHDLFFAGGDCSSEGARRGAEALAESIVRGERVGGEQ